MGKTKPNPRYNILSCRVSDELKECIDRALGGRTRQDFLHRAVTDLLISERRQAHIDDHLRSIGVTKL